ncbi:MAG: DUF115 domain-containing protein [Bacteroidetes bacterium]|nr:MAG: DUF115 domain-containing protein [Bacteroidota bacterium]
MDNYIKQLNPQLKLGIYRMSLGFVKNRLKWDLSSKARQSKKRFTDLGNSQHGKKAVILCNGPSLNNVDFELLKEKGVFTIGLNKINLLFDRTEFRPSMIVAINKLVIEQNKDFYNQTDIELILDSASAHHLNKRPNVNFIYSLPFQLKFAGDIRGAVCQGYTVTYAAMQIAFHLGFSEVALVGCDHNFVTKGSPNMKVKSGETDPNHFSKDYFSGGAEWQLPDLLGSEIHYKMADEFYKAHGRKIYNATEGGKLEIYERIQLNDFLNG